MSSSTIGVQNPKIEEVTDDVWKLGPLGEPKVLCSYLILGNEISVVDCGPSSVIDELLNLLAECNVSPNDVDNLLLTHVHIDHAGGTARFLDSCKNARAFVPTRGYKHLLDPKLLNSSAKEILGAELFDSWGKALPVSPSRIKQMFHAERLENANVKYIETRGHAPHHDVLLLEKERVLFAADALGIQDNYVEDFHSPTSPPPSFNLDIQTRDFDTIESLDLQHICLAHFRAIVPTREFYRKTRELYSNWERIIGRYLAQKNIKGSSLNQENIEEIFSMLALEYPSYANIPPRLEFQVKRVDIRGFAQWFDYKRETQLPQNEKRS